jgi:hypothetical protein
MIPAGARLAGTLVFPVFLPVSHALLIHLVNAVSIYDQSSHGLLLSNLLFPYLIYEYFAKILIV